MLRAAISKWEEAVCPCRRQTALYLWRRNCCTDSEGDSESGYSAGRNLERNVFYGKREYAFLWLFYFHTWTLFRRRRRQPDVSLAERFLRIWYPWSSGNVKTRGAAGKQICCLPPQRLWGNVRPFIHSHLERQNSYGCRRQGMDGLYCPGFRQRSFRCFPSGISGNFTWRNLHFRR